MKRDKTCSVFLVALLFSGVACSCLGEVIAQTSIPEPSVPQFTVQLVSKQYSVPAVTPTYTIDPYNGEQKLVNPGSEGYTGVNRYIELRITNQHYSLSNGSERTIYYNFRMKGHFEQEWTEKHPTYSDVHGCTFISSDAPVQSTSDVTVISFIVETQSDNPNAVYPPDAQLDFQVSAMVGVDSEAYWYPHIGIFVTESTPAIALISQSGWSSTQTISLADSSVSAQATPNPTPSPDPPLPAASSPSPTTTSAQPESTFELNWIELGAFAVLVTVVFLLAVFFVFMRRKIRVLERKLDGTKDT
jgi:hypothetical protein